MIKIDLTPTQIKELRNFYIGELERINQRKAEIISMLKTIGEESAVEETTTVASYVEEPAVAKETKAPGAGEEEKSKSGKPPEGRIRWSDFILDKLKENDKPITLDEVFKAYQKEHNIKFPDFKAAKASLSQSFHYLQYNKKQIESFPRKGKRGNFYKLVENKGGSQVVKEKPVRQAKAKKKEEPKKTTHAPKNQWADFIVDTLNKTKKVLNRNEILDLAMRHFLISPKHRISTRGKLSPVLSHMANKTEQLKTVKKPDERGKYYGLAEWFDEKGNLPSEYLNNKPGVN